MAKKRSWFNQLKRFFISDANSRSEKKEKRKIWAFGRFKTRRLASLSAPSPQDKKALNEANGEKQKCAIDKAAAIAFETPRDTTEAVWPNGSNPESSIQCKTESTELASINLYKPIPQSHQCNLEIQRLAAIKIQSAFRGYLARKALRALKGLVRLQAIIRGWAVRRQAMTTLKCLQTIVNIQSDFCSKRCDTVKETQHNEENSSQDSMEKDIKIDSNSQRRMDDTLLLNSQKRWDDSPLSLDVYKRQACLMMIYVILSFSLTSLELLLKPKRA